MGVGNNRGRYSRHGQNVTSLSEYNELLKKREDFLKRAETAKTLTADHKNRQGWRLLHDELANFHNSRMNDPRINKKKPTKLSLYYDNSNPPKPHKKRGASNVFEVLWSYQYDTPYFNWLELRPYKRNHYIGYVKEDTLHPTNSAHALSNENKEKVWGIMKELREHGLLNCLATYGLAVSNCGVCGKALTDPISIKMGIGPECAKRFGLYGERMQLEFNMGEPLPELGDF